MKKFNLLACAAVAVAAGSFFATEAGAFFGSTKVDGVKMKSFSYCSASNAKKELQGKGSHCKGHLSHADFSKLASHIGQDVETGGGRWACNAGDVDKIIEEMWEIYYHGHTSALKHAPSSAVFTDLRDAWTNYAGGNIVSCHTTPTKKHGLFHKAGSEVVVEKGRAFEGHEIDFSGKEAAKAGKKANKKKRGLHL